MIHADNIKWQRIKAINFSNQHHAVLRDNELGVQCEVISNKNSAGFAKKGKSFYFIDNDDREFLTADEMVEAYNEKFKFEDENPEHEVVYVKVIKKRDRKCSIEYQTTQPKP